LAAMLAAGPLHHLGVFSDQVGLDDVIGTGPSGWLGLGQSGLGGEPLGNDLIGCLPLQHALPTGVVGGIEAAQELFELIVRRDGDGEHLGADAAIEALDHAVGLRRARLDMAIRRSEFGTDLGKGCSWLRVSGATERPQIDQCERHQFHAVVPLLFEFKAQQNPLEFIFPREGALHA
jgi:hypothetical protein